MALPEPVLPRRRLQILDDETRDGPNVGAHRDIRAPQDTWIENFMTRLGALVRRTGGRK